MSLTATNAQVYKGTAAVTYGGGPGDPTTVLLMHCDGTNGGTSFTDSSSYNQTITNAGSVVTSTAAQKFGTASFYTNGTAGNYYLSVTSSALMFGTGDFTIEFWMNPSDPASTTRNQRLMGNLPLGSYNSGAWAIGFNTGDNGKLHIDINNVINGWTATTAQVAGTWYHIAMVRSGSTWYFFQNGVLQSTTTSTASFDNGGVARPVYVGWSGYSTTIANEYYNGYLDEIRFTYGKALYTSNFTVATSPFTISSTTTLSLPGAIGSYFLLPPTHPVNYDPSTSNVFVEAWVYWSGSSWTAGGQTGGAIYEKENAGGTVQDFGLYVDSAQKLTAYMYTQNGNILRPIYTTALSVQRWYHVAFGYNTVNQTAYVWVNGQVGTTSTASNPARYSVTYTYIGNNPVNAPTVYAWLGYIQDLRVTRGGTVPTTTFTPGSAPFGLANPSYVSGGTTVLSLATQYYQTSMRLASAGTIQFTSRPPLTPVLTNPGTLQLTVGQVVTISQTANQPANGITWTFGPTGTGLNLTSTTDYGMTLTTASGVTSTLFTVTATNRAGLTTVVQFVAGSSLYSMTYPFTFTNMSATGANGPTSITYGSSNPGFGTGYAMVLGTGTSTGMQRWTVPDSGPYTFTIAGAGVQHLNNTSSSPYNVNYISYGAVGTSTITLTAGHVLRILVGQQGTRGQSGVFARCGGCGGSFVYNETTSTLLLAAGGGGGHGGDPGGATLGAGTTGDPYRNGTGKGDDGQLGTSGTIGRAGNGGTAGINGAGGGGNTQGYGGDGGAGFNGDGNVNTANGNSVTPAKAFINGGNGAIGGNSPGGFGGGGSGGNNGGAGAGGGGGYSGGGGGANQGNGEGGGGGGSYTVGTFTSSSATNLGMGYVIVTR
jgi:hypothetical protein